MRDAIADLVRDGDTVAIEGFTHLIWFAAGHEIIRQRRRDLTLARLTPDVIYDQMIAAGVARKLVFSWLGNPGVGGLGRHPPPDRGRDPRRAARGRGVQPLRDGRALHGRRDEPAVLPAPQLLRDRPAGRQPADPADRLAVRRRDDLRGPAAPARRHDRPRPAGLGRRRHPGLGPARLPEGGGVRGRPGHRRGRGGRRRGGHPRRPEPDDHPGPHRGRRRRRAVGRAPLVRPGRLRPGQPLLPGLGPDHPRRGRDPGLAARVGLRPRRPGGLRGEARGRADRVAHARAGAVRRRSTTGTTAERVGRRRHLHQVRDDDRRGGARARRASTSASSASGCRTSRSTSPSARSRPISSSSTRPASSAPGRRGCRCRSATRRS